MFSFILLIWYTLTNFCVEPSFHSRKKSHLGLMYNPFRGFLGSSAGRESACKAGDPSWILGSGSFCKAGDPSSIPGSGSFPGEGTGYLFQYSWASPGGSAGKESALNAGGLCSIPGLGRSPGREHSNPLHYFCLENPIDRGAWWDTVHVVTKSQT